MPLQPQIKTATLKTNVNLKTTVNTRHNIGQTTMVSQDSEARVLGVPGDQGVQGDQGIQGDQGVQGQTGKPGINWLSEYDPSLVYQLNDAVSYLNSSYIWINGIPSAGNEPPNPLYWDLLAGAGTSNSGDLHYTYYQNVASALWIIDHNLSKFPSVSIIDSGGTNVIGDVRYISPQTVQIEFSSDFTGTAYLN